MTVFNAANPHSATAALLLAHEKFPDGLVLSGTGAFVHAMTRAAVDLGLEHAITNPEMAPFIAALTTARREGQNDSQERYEELARESATLDPAAFRDGVKKAIGKTLFATLGDHFGRPIAPVTAELECDAPLLGIYHIVDQGVAVVDGPTGLVAVAIDQRQEREIRSATHVHLRVSADRQVSIHPIRRLDVGLERGR